MVAERRLAEVPTPMPRAAIAAGVVDVVVALDDMPAHICEVVGWKV